MTQGQIVTAIDIVGVCLTVIFGFGQHAGITMPKWFAITGVIIGIVLLAASPLIFLLPTDSDRVVVGNDAVVMGNVTGNVGDRSVVIGATDNSGNTILTTPMAVGDNAHAGPNSIAIGAGASAGNTITGPCSSVGQQGGKQTINCTFQGKPSQIRILGQLPTRDNPDGTFTVPIVIDVHPQIPLIATACGDDVLSVNLSIMTGMMSTGRQTQPKHDNCEAALYDGVYGQWVINVVVKSKTSEFQYYFNEPQL